MYVDNKILLSGKYPIVDLSSTISLKAGNFYDFVVEYSQSIGPAKLVVMWEYPTQTQTQIPATRMFTPERVSSSVKTV
jgi:hypothetical protein